MLIPLSRGQPRSHLCILDLWGNRWPLNSASCLGQQLLGQAEFADSWVLAPEQSQARGSLSFNSSEALPLSGNARALSYLYFCAADYQDSWERTVGQEFATLGRPFSGSDLQEDPTQIPLHRRFGGAGTPFHTQNPCSAPLGESKVLHRKMVGYPRR